MNKLWTTVQHLGRDFQLAEIALELEIANFIPDHSLWITRFEDVRFIEVLPTNARGCFT